MQTETLKVSGMSCGACIGKVTSALKALSGVGKVDVSLSSGEAAVQYDDRLVSPGQLKAAVDRAGYGADVKGHAHGHRSKGCCCG